MIRVPIFQIQRFFLEALLQWVTLSQAQHVASARLMDENDSEGIDLNAEAGLYK